MNNGSMTCRISFNLNYLRNLEKSKYFIFIEIFTTILREKQLDIKMKEVNHESTLFRNYFNTSPEKSKKFSKFFRIPETTRHNIQLQITPTTKQFKTCSKIHRSEFLFKDTNFWNNSHKFLRPWMKLSSATPLAGKTWAKSISFSFTEPLNFSIFPIWRESKS